MVEVMEIFSLRNSILDSVLLRQAALFQALDLVYDQNLLEYPF